MHSLIGVKRPEIAALCRRFHVRRLEVFGSAARGEDFDPARSDADFLVEFGPDADQEFDAYAGMKQALERMLDRPVDLVERQAIEQSRNYIRRRRILGEAKPVYVA